MQHTLIFKPIRLAPVFYRLGLLLFLSLITVEVSADQKTQTLRVLCYNIHYGQGTDGKYDISRLARVIQETKPDLVALQEVDVGVKRSNRVHEAQRLAELTGLAVRFGPTQHYEGGLFGKRRPDATPDPGCNDPASALHGKYPPTGNLPPWCHHRDCPWSEWKTTSIYQHALST